MISDVNHLCYQTQSFGLCIVLLALGVGNSWCWCLGVVAMASRYGPTMMTWAVSNVKHDRHQAWHVALVTFIRVIMNKQMNVLVTFVKESFTRKNQGIGRLWSPAFFKRRSGTWPGASRGLIIVDLTMERKILQHTCVCIHTYNKNMYTYLCVYTSIWCCIQCV